VPKPLFFQEAKQRFAPFLHKIIHVIIDDFPHKEPVADGRQWENERFQRETGVVRGLSVIPNLSDEDLVVHSDLDEIVNPNLLKSVRAGRTMHDCNTLEMDMYYYNLTTYVSAWNYPAIVKVRQAKQNSCRGIGGVNTIQNAGWHLSYFGDADFVRNKIMHFAHQEFNHPTYTDRNNIEDAIKSGKDIYGREGFSVQRICMRDNVRVPPRLDLLVQFCVDI
jgi:beta-1,4-mannosyl-glycoprotein beta-1,4-N-acetylglucosaminyltransferase